MLIQTGHLFAYTAQGQLAIIHIRFRESARWITSTYPDRVLNGYVKVRWVGESIIEEFVGRRGVRWSSK
ncbi:hypothetical protein D3C87_2127140 [compost metagenome]